MDIQQWVQDIVNCCNAPNVLPRQRTIGVLEKSPVQSSLDSFFLEPADYPPGNMDRQRRVPRPIAASGSSVLSCGSSAEEKKPRSEDRYRRKHRRKTRIDLYEPRTAKVKNTPRKRTHALEKSNGGNQRRTSKTEPSKVPDFQAGNLGPGRLTVCSALGR
jgi:hypothetical protein